MAGQREFDAELAARSVRELAAVTDAELAAGIRAAAAEVFEYAERWREAPGWPFIEADRRVYAAVAAASEALTHLPADAGSADVTSAATPLLNQWWPEYPDSAAAVSQAVERLRYATKHRPRMVAEARLVVPGRQ